MFDYISDLALYQKMADSVFQAFKNNKITLPEFQPFKLKDANLAHNMLESEEVVEVCIWSLNKSL